MSDNTIIIEFELSEDPGVSFEYYIENPTQPVTDYEELTEGDEDDQHPISAITNSSTTLEGL